MAILKGTGLNSVKLPRYRVPTYMYLIIPVFIVALPPYLQRAGADALELNLSCPHGMGERGMGLACGQV